MKSEFELRLLALTQEAQQAIENLTRTRSSIELFSMEDIADIGDPKIDIFAYPAFPNYDAAEGPLEYAAIQSLYLSEDGVLIKGILRNRNFPECIEIHLWDLDAASATELADHLCNTFENE